MKTLTFLILLFIIGIHSIAFGQSYTNYRPLNFECGGWVSEVIPFPDKNHTITIANNSILYARTDVGGAYYSNNNGASWNYISTYYDIKPQGPEFSPSFLNIQGIAVHPENPDIVLVAWGLEEWDAKNAKSPINSNVDYQCLWKSTDHGNSWTKPYIDPQFKVWFKGNDNSNTHFEKLGGECIIFSPKKPDETYDMYMGGVPKSGQNSKLFKSTDEGNNWTPIISFPGEENEIITTIAMKAGTEQIWVGTSNNVYVSTNLGQTWQKVLNTYANMNVKRIILGTYNNETVAFLTFGNGGTVGIGKIKWNLDLEKWEFQPEYDLTYQFDSGISPLQDKSTHFCTLFFPYKTDGTGIDYNHLIAGRYGRPIRESFGEDGNEPGGIWSGFKNILNSSDGQIVFKFGPENFYPNHQFNNEEFVYTGLNNVTQNPNFPDHWYASGGAGAYKSDNVNIVNSTNSGYTSFSNITWQYMTTNMSMPVVNDITFNTSQNITLFPIADWILGWTNNFGIDFSKLNYDRRNIGSHFGNEYTSFATRAINCILQGNENRTYILGCYQYTVSSNDRKATFYYRDQTGDNITYTRKITDPLLNYSNRFFADGIQFPYTENNVTVNRICALVGQQDAKASPDPNDLNKLGIYFSTNEGTNWSPGSFTGPSNVMGVTTNQAYSGALLPGLSGAVGSVFDPEFNLAYDGTYVYLYLEVGGVFRSSNGGIWDLMPDPPIPDLYPYKDEGCIKADRTNGKLYLAIKGNPTQPRKGGLFYSTDQANSWTYFDGWEEATCVEASGQNIAAFGRRTQNGNTDLNKLLYKSNDGGQNWTRITDLPSQNSMTLTPRVRSLRIRPDSPNELWIATSGEGVIVYNNFHKDCLANITDHHIIQYQNYIHDCDNDIVVKNGGFLEIKNCSSFKMPSGKSIKVESGGKLICDHVNFDCSNSNEMFGGIELSNVAAGTEIKNCKFDNAISAIKITNIYPGGPIYTWPSDVPINGQDIEKNIFNITGTGSIGIEGYNVYRLILTGNIFTTGSNCQSVVLVNNIRIPQYGLKPLCNDIIDNIFNGGELQLSLTGFDSELASYYIENNQLNTSEGICFFGRMITGSIEKNIFESNGVNTLDLFQSSPYLLGNEIINKGTGICLNSQESFPILAPILDENDNFIWYGGWNVFNSSDADNIQITHGYPIVDWGINNFTVRKPEYFHISGEVEDSLGDTYYCRDNCWFGGENGMPLININNNIIRPLRLNYESNISCTQQLSYNGYFLSQITNNIYDTIFTSIDNTGSPVPLDEINFSVGLKDKETTLFTEAVSNFKNIINNYPASKYLNGSMIELYSCYEKMDTLNINNRITLFTELKNYIAQKIQQYQSNQGFTDVAYNLLLMSKVMIGELNDAADGYLFLSLNHPEPERRLLASMDYEGVIEVMGSGGSEKEIDLAYSFIEKNVEDYIIKDTLAKITSKNYDKEKKNIKLNANANKVKIDIVKEKKFDDKVRYNLLNTKHLSKEQKNKNRIEDIMLIAGVKQTRTKEITNTVPTKYQLYQNYPNPFNPITKIAFDLPNDANVKLIIYDILGREIKTLVNNEFKKAGKYLVEFNGGNFASGVYFYRIQSGDFISVKKMVMIK